VGGCGARAAARRAPAEERLVGLDELGADLLLVLERLDPLALLLLEVRRRLLRHHLALALDLRQPRVVDLPLLRHLRLAHLGDQLALLLLLLVTQVLLLRLRLRVRVRVRVRG